MNGTRKENERVFAVSASGIVTVFDRTQTEPLTSEDHLATQGSPKKESVTLSLEART